MKGIRQVALLFIVFWGATTTTADELLQAGESLDEFGEFLSRDNVNIRGGSNNIPMKRFRYELRQAQVIEGGCRHSDGEDHDEWAQGEPVIATEIAHDLTTCTHLYFVGIPSPGGLLDWLKSPFESSVEDAQKTGARSPIELQPLPR